MQDSLKINFKLLFICLSVLIVFIKILILPLTSFPYDFATYVYQIRQYYEFGIHPLFFWNKGAFLHGIFFTNYLVYDFFRSIFNFNESTLLLHFFYKLPLLIFDLLIGFVIWKCTHIYGLNSQKRYLLVLLWLLSPIVLWATEIEGKYAIIASFFSIVSYALYISNKKQLSLIPLAISASIYYYAFILFPVYLFFYIKDKKNGIISFDSIKYISIFAITTTVLFSPFLICFRYLIPFTNSLLYHTQPDAPIDVTEIDIPDYSFFKMPFYVIKDYFPTNISSPEYFALVSKVTLLAFIFTLFYLIYLYIKIYSNKILYTPQIFLKCNLVVLLIFVIFIGKFQAHYLIWILPYIILFQTNQSKRLYFLYFLISIFPIINTLGRLNLGIYFLDSVPWGIINFWLNFSDVVNALIGSIVFVSLLLILLLVIKTQRSEVRINSKNKVLYFIILVFFITNLLYIFPAIKSYGYLLNNSHPERLLASDNRVLRFGYSKIDYSYVDFSSNETQLLNADFSQMLLNSNNIVLDFISPWDIFVSKGGKAYLSADNDVRNEKKLILEANDVSSHSELNMGSNNSLNLIPINYNKEYLVSLIAKSSNNKGSFSISVRYADENRKIISGSDIVISNNIEPNNWTEYSKTIRPDNINYKYVEIVVTAQNNSLKFIENNTISVKSINLTEKDIPKQIKYTIHGKSNIPIIQYEIFDRPEVRSKFDLVVEISSTKHYDVKKIKLNDCVPNQLKTSTEGGITLYSFIFSSNCAEYNIDSDLFIEYVDVPAISDIQIAMLKK